LKSPFMKTAAFVAALALMLSPVASASSKFVSEDYGFAASFVGNVEQTTETDIARFNSSNADRTLLTQVQVLKVDLSGADDMDKYLDVFLTAMVKNTVLHIVDQSHTTFQGFPAAKVRLSMLNPSGVDVDITMLLIVVKGKSRIYTVAGMAGKTNDHSGIQPFLDSFEIR
jgi:hypothetical protein